MTVLILCFLQTLDVLCRSLGCSYVVDIGAGQGHLSRLMTFGYGFKVTTIEASGCHKPKANKFDRYPNIDNI